MQEKGFWQKLKGGFVKFTAALKDKMYISVLFWLGKLIFRDRWKGIKGLVLGICVFLLGLWTWLQDQQITDKLCQLSDSLCGIEDSAFYGFLLMFVGALQQVIRVITDTPVNSKLPVNK